MIFTVEKRLRFNLNDFSFPQMCFQDFGNPYLNCENNLVAEEGESTCVGPIRPHPKGIGTIGDREKKNNEEQTLDQNQNQNQYQNRNRYQIINTDNETVNESEGEGAVMEAGKGDGRISLEDAKKLLNNSESKGM